MLPLRRGATAVQDQNINIMSLPGPQLCFALSFNSPSPSPSPHTASVSLSEPHMGAQAVIVTHQ